MTGKLLENPDDYHLGRSDRNREDRHQVGQKATHKDRQARRHGGDDTAAARQFECLSKCVSASSGSSPVVQQQQEVVGTDVTVSVDVAEAKRWAGNRALSPSAK